MLQRRVLKAQIGSLEGYRRSRFNAVKHGILSNDTVLPWEDPEEYEGLLGSFVKEHGPIGPTEEHLVEELAGIIWRKRRLRLAETATFRRGLKDTVEEGIPRPHLLLTPVTYSSSATAALISAGQHVYPVNTDVTEAIHCDAEEAAQQADELRAASAQARKALRLLRDGKDKAYERALSALNPETRELWRKSLGEGAGELDPNYTTTADGLAEWIENQGQPQLQNRLVVLEHRDAIRTQAFGDAFKPEQLENLARYETHLDRKLEHTLAMLVKLQQLRRERQTDGD